MKVNKDTRTTGKLGDINQVYKKDSLQDRTNHTFPGIYLLSEILYFSR